MFTIIPNGNLFTLAVKHTCGHTGNYCFGTKEAAEKDGPDYNDRVCLDCGNSKAIKDLELFILKSKFYYVQSFCENINKALDEGITVLDNRGIKLDGRWRIQFKEPPWDNLEQHCWFEEITLQINESGSTVGLFDPEDDTMKVKSFWDKWVAINPKYVTHFT